MFRNLLIGTLLLIAAPFAYAAPQCSVELTGNDQLQFNLNNIEVSRACEEFTINFRHIGQLARNVMGHNVVITTSTDMDAVNRDGMSAGLDNNYVKPNDARVIAHTKIIGGGETTSLTIKPSQLKDGTPYSFFCSFPGHASMMKGTLKLVP